MGGRSADKYIRQKKYTCLIPGCTSVAINSHSIQESVLKESLAVNNHLYTLNRSLSSLLDGNNNPFKEREVKLTPLSKAGTFKGFCSHHDNDLFHSIESESQNQKDNMYTSLYTRSLSLEYCRKREASEMLKKIADFQTDNNHKKRLTKASQQFDEIALYIKKFHLNKLFKTTIFRRKTEIEFFLFPIPNNIYVSACGIFNENNNDLESIIAFNLISHNNLSYLCLTSLKCNGHYIEKFLDNYMKVTVTKMKKATDGTKDILEISDSKKINGLERMLNDIAFLKCEEPLISPKLWNKLSLGKRKLIRQSLVHPAYRSQNNSIEIIKYPDSEWNLASAEEITKRIKESIIINEKINTFTK